MTEISEYIRAGMIELYVLGLTTALETKEVEQLAAKHAEVRAAIDEFSETLEQHVLATAVAPDPNIKPMLLAFINYMDRMEKGEPASFPPILNEGAELSVYAEWLTREDMMPPAAFENFYARIIGYTPEVTTAIIWLKDMAPAEVHTDELEKFLIAEGTCDIIIEEEIHQLTPGDFLSIPLFKNHVVKVTSATPCKLILQRVAA